MKRDQRGSATVLALPLLAVLLLLSLLLGVLGGLVVAQRRAQAAADLAALAGAASVQRGGDGCSVAASLARRNGAELEACRQRVSEVQVRVAVDVAGPGGRSWTVRAHARAGPAGSQSELWEDSSDCNGNCAGPVLTRPAPRPGPASPVATRPT